jgi:hypothetical protein
MYCLPQRFVKAQGKEAVPAYLTLMNDAGIVFYSTEDLFQVAEF